MNNEDINLIKCGDHKWAPWSVVCVHLMSGQSREWVPIESTSPEVDFDWVCPECLPNSNLEHPNLTYIRPVCIHCVRALRKQYDPNFEEEG